MCSSSSKVRSIRLGAMVCSITQRRPEQRAARINSRPAPLNVYIPDAAPNPLLRMSSQNLLPAHRYTAVSSLEDFARDPRFAYSQPNCVKALTRLTGTPWGIRPLKRLIAAGNILAGKWGSRFGQPLMAQMSVNKCSNKSASASIRGTA